MKIIINKKGITLIALIITIIVILLIAGISLNLILGDNGILKKARIAKEETDMAQVEENDILGSYSNNINQYIVTSSRGQINISNLDDNLLKLYETYINDFPKNITDLINDKTKFANLITDNNSAQYIIDNPNDFLDKIVNSQDSIITIAKSDYAGYKMIMNDQWRNAILNSTYFTDFCQNSDLVPKMTASTTNGYTVTATTSFNQNASNWVGWRAFDNDTTSSYTWYPIIFPSWIEVEYPENIALFAVYYDDLSYSSDITCKIQSSSNGADWTDRSDLQTISKGSYIKLNSTESAKYWRLYLTTTYSTYYNLEFYGEMESN